MRSSIRERLEPQGGRLVGRASERAFLDRVHDDDGPLVVFVNGIGGVGKSALLRAFASEAQARGSAVVQLDGATVEPSTQGFLAALSARIGQVATVQDAARCLSSLGPRVVIVLDHCEHLQPLDPWLRQTFLPELDDGMRLVLAGRFPPVAAWSMTLGPLFRSLRLVNLPPTDAERLLEDLGVCGQDATRINRLARGHPLSLRLAAAALGSGADHRVDRGLGTVSVLVTELTELYLDRLDPLTRRILDAASVVRRPTTSLLRAMLPDLEPYDAFERLRALPFVELEPDGLVLHETVRAVVAAYLRASDPERWRRCRIAAWRQLRGEVWDTTRHDMSRRTADLLDLVEDPRIRETWLPSADPRYTVDAARTTDLPAILEISSRLFPGESASVLQAWWRHVPSAFRVARDESEEVRGFSGVSDPTRLPRALADVDPIVRRWRDHLRESPLPPGQVAVGYHFERADPQDLDADAIHSALWLDACRRWMELRPAIRRHYGVTSLRSDWEAPTLTGLQPLGPPVVSHGRTSYPFWIDFGPASVDGWLATLIGVELQVDDHLLLDPAQRQVIVDDRRVDLTGLEFGVLRLLAEHADRVVERSELMREVWGYADSGGSNVLEAVVRSLRLKLGLRADAIETVRGIGYRFAPDAGGRSGDERFPSTERDPRRRQGSRRWVPGSGSGALGG